MPQYLDANGNPIASSAAAPAGGKTYLDPNTGEPIKSAAASTQPAPQPSMLQTAGQGALDLGKGILKGGMNTIRGIGNLEQKIPGVSSLMPADVKDYLGPAGDRANATHGIMQGLGKGAEQAGEFLLPGRAEEAGASKLAAMAPRLGRAAEPLAKVATSALGSGTVNSMQGGSFGAGAGAGAAGGAIGAGLKAVAPKIAEGALGITKVDRAFGKTPGQAILNETSGFGPEKIAASAQERMGQLTPQLEAAADRASVRPQPVKALLQAPAQEIPLAANSRNPKMHPMAFDAKVNPEEPMEPRSGNPLAPISEYPGINPHYLSGSAHPELSGRVPTNQGVLIRPQEIPAGAKPLPTMVPNPVASLGPARNVLRSAADTASNQNAEGLHGQIGNMQDFLSRRFGSGEQIPENVTPRQLLDLKRGFNEEHLRWNPEIHDKALSTGRQAYGALDQELDRTVPEAAGLNQRLSSLIPVARRAESVGRNASTAQRVMGRFGRPTGALLGASVGGAAGAREGGTPGAIAGGITGLVAPELLASPETQMIMARGMNRAGSLRPIVGGALQANRKSGQ
jgi:hypothetical protein